MIHRLRTFLTTDSYERDKAVTGAAFTVGAVITLLVVAL